MATQPPLGTKFRAALGIQDRRPRSLSSDNDATSQPLRCDSVCRANVLNSTVLDPLAKLPRLSHHRHVCVSASMTPLVGVIGILAAAAPLKLHNNFRRVESPPPVITPTAGAWYHFEACYYSSWNPEPRPLWLSSGKAAAVRYRCTVRTVRTVRTYAALSR